MTSHAYVQVLTNYLYVTQKTFTHVYSTFALTHADHTEEMFFFA